MIAKLICFAETRELAILKTSNALDELIVDGISTNINLHKKILKSETFISGRHNIHSLEKLIHSQ